MKKYNFPIDTDDLQQLQEILPYEASPYLSLFLEQITADVNAPNYTGSVIVTQLERQVVFDALHTITKSPNLQQKADEINLGGRPTHLPKIGELIGAANGLMLTLQNATEVSKPANASWHQNKPEN